MKKSFLFRLKKIAAFFTFSILCCSFTFAFGTNFWNKADVSSFNQSGERTVFPEKFEALRLDLTALRSALSLAPKEYAVNRLQGLELSVPMPDGTFKRFSVLETEVMHPKLAAKYPLIKTYVAIGIDDVHSWMRMDLSYLGFHAMISTLSGFVFIDPVNNTELENYISYYKADMPNAYDRHCEFKNTESEEERITKALSMEQNKGSLKIHDSGDELRTYRLALACTGEYAATKGGTVLGALSGMVTSVNRVDGIYQVEVAVRMVLIANTDTLIFLNSGTDPYTNNNGGTMLGQNQSTVTARIGASNYDFGHVFSTGGGGIAGLGVICDNTQKAYGVTGLPNPVGDSFDVDYVAHEMGHQFGGNHTFNSNTAGSCAGNAAMGHNFEPGSGTTIMAYAGSCGSADLQQHSDVLFHTGSYDEIFNYTIFAFGNTCALVTSTNNSPPIINPTNDYTIPFKTPFILTGSAYDPDGDSLTYIWEEYDSGPFGAPNSPSGNAAIFRDFTPSTDSTRTFPKLINIINNTSVIGERLPTYARTLHFKFTARDNKMGGGGISNNPTPVNVNVINTITPFQVSIPNANTVLWHFGSSEFVSWDVSSTDATPISCTNVNILLSIDGGYTFPYVLAANSPNDGSENVLIPTSGGLPNINTNLARIKVEAVGNIFFDMSDANFSIQNPNDVRSNQLTENEVQLYPNPAKSDLSIEFNSFYTGKILVNITDCLGRLIYQEETNKQEFQMQMKIDISNLAQGTYFVELNSAKAKVCKRFVKL